MIRPGQVIAVEEMIRQRQAIAVDEMQWQRRVSVKERETG